MVINSQSIRLPNKKMFFFRSKLTCADWGVYAAECQICGEWYVGQTTNSFSKRWNNHRHMWKSGAKNTTDQAALRVHYDHHHPGEKNKALPSAYKVVFVDKPRTAKLLDFTESVWINRLQAKININKTVLPKIT